MEPVTFVYRNYKGETEVRHVAPLSLDYITKPGFDYQPGWFLTGYDLDRDGAVRSFSLSHIILPNSNIYILWGKRPIQATPSSAAPTQGEMARQQGYTGDTCQTCGSARMKMAGHCMVCEECGSTTGCS